MGEIAMAKKTKYAAGIEIESAFGRTDYMYVYEVAPWAYDAVSDWIKVAIQGVVDVDITDDWARQLGKVDLSRYLGAACGLLNPIHVGITVAGAIVDPRQIRALTAADIVSAAQSGVWSVGRTWALAIATDSVVAQVSNWPALYAMNLTQYISAACGLLNPVHVGITVAGAIVDPRQIRALTAADIVTADSLTKWGGIALTGRDVSLDLKELSDWSLEDQCKTLTRQYYDHYSSLKDGLRFYGHNLYQNVNNGVNAEMGYLVNPANSGYNVVIEEMFIESSSSAGIVPWYIYLDPTVSANGTASTSYNKKAGGGASAITIYRGPTVTSAGSLAYIAIFSGYFSPVMPIGVMIPPNHTALLRALNSTGVNATLIARPTWREEAV